jgi:PhnB protein
MAESTFIKQKLKVMAQVNPYLVFEGNCREAMNFYKDCFGGKLAFQTVGESPMADQLAPHPSDAVLHSSLEAKNFTLMGSDMHWPGFSNGNAYHLSIECDSENEVNTLFSNLGEGGKITQPLALMPWGATHGQLVDKFGKSWFFNYSKS